MDKISIMRTINYRYYLVFLFVLTLLTGEINAQQEPMFTQYMFNTLSINPAIAGTKKSINANSLSRFQWVGMEGSPKTFSVGLHSPVNNRKIGVGLTILSDKIGPVTNTHISLNYAYRLIITEDLTLSMGIKGGISSYYAGLSHLDVIDNEDPQFIDNEKKLSPNLGFGFYLYHERFYVGFAVPKLLETSIDEEYAESFTDLKRHYYIHAGYTMQLSSEWVFKPSLLTKAVSGSPTSNDITLQFLYNNKIWIGGMYRLGDAAGLFGDVAINRQLMLGYGYDSSLNSMMGANSGSHELMIIYEFDIRRKSIPLF